MSFKMTNMDMSIAIIPRRAGEQKDNLFLPYVLAFISQSKNLISSSCYFLSSILQRVNIIWSDWRHNG